MAENGIEGEPKPEAEKPAKRWARKYDACVKCGTTEGRHAGHGYCHNCLKRKRYAESKGRAIPEAAPFPETAPTPVKPNNDGKVIVGLAFGPEILAEIIEKASDKLADKLIERMR